MTEAPPPAAPELTAAEITELAAQLEPKTPQQILRRALEQHARIALSFSGAEDVVLINMAVEIDPAVRVFCLDTGRLHAQTYEFIERVRNHYQIEIEVMFPDPAAVQALTSEKGLFSFLRDGHTECCSIRKTEPLRRKLATLDAWVTGQRRDQSPGTRNQLAVVQSDASNAAPGATLVTYNPLAGWTSQQVWDYIRAYEVPFNPLHGEGFVSIGCAPCTRPITPGQHEREGRWWWEAADNKECGLHAINLQD